MEQSPQEADSQSPSKRFVNLLWNPKVHYHEHNSPPAGPTGHVV
jgi:hypothetical protein